MSIRMHQALLTLACLAGLFLRHEHTAAQEVPDTPSSLVVAQQTTQQKLAQLEAKRTAQRLDAMLQVLAYHQLDAEAEKKLVLEAASALRGLSQNQMAEILRNFETASQAKSLTDMDKKIDQAQAQHRDVLDQVRRLLTRFEMMRNLEQAAVRLDKLAFDQKKLREQVILAEQQRRLQANQRKGMRPESPQTQALRQEDIARETESILQKLHELKSDLPEELLPRIEKVISINSERRIKANMLDAASQLRYRNQREAEDRQIQAQSDLERLARTLRTPADKLGLLTEARDRVHRLKEQQSQLLQDTLQGKTPKEDGSTSSKPEAPELRGARLSTRQAELQVETRDIKDLLTEIAPGPAKVLELSTGSMNIAKERLRSSQPGHSEQPQEQAIRQLTEAHRLLEVLAAEEEKAQRDPLTALQRAMEELDKLIARQKQLKLQTKDIQESTKPDPHKPLARKQQILAEQTEAVIAKPLAAKPEHKLLIQTAAEAMHQASEHLHGLEGQSALDQQQRALDDLQRARKALEEDAREIEQRREEIATLEAAMKKLEDLIGKQSELSDASNKMSKEPATPERQTLQNELVFKQDSIQQDTRKLQEEVAKPAPQSKEPLTQAMNKMGQGIQAWKQNEWNTATEASQGAKSELEQAQRAIRESLDQKQAEEAVAEAAQNPDRVNPAEAAIHVAKALMESNEASKEASEAVAKPNSPENAIKQSEAATKSAQAAIDQARAMSPQNVQATLQQAREKLEQARQQLNQSTPAKAQKNQEQASKDLSQALQSLEQIMAAMQKQEHQQDNAQKQPQNNQEGQQGQQQGKQTAKDGKPDKSSEGDSKEKNTSADPNQSGDRDGNAKSEKTNADGKSTFVNLPARQRDLIMQALGDKLPSEHASQIQRYFESIATGKSATDKPKK